MKKKLSRRDITKQIGLATAIGMAGPARALTSMITPTQVEGPFHPIDAQKDTDLDLTLVSGRVKSAKGDVILVRGQVLDTEGRPVNGALVDVWQANHDGRYNHPDDKNTAPLDPNFQGWGLIKTNDEGRYSFKTIKPGAYPLSFLGEEGWRCRHIHFKVSQPDHKALTTQMYFHGDPLIEQDLEINGLPEEQRHYLIAKSVTDESIGLPLYTFDIVVGKA